MSLLIALEELQWRKRAKPKVYVYALIPPALTATRITFCHAGVYGEQRLVCIGGDAP